MSVGREGGARIEIWAKPRAKKSRVVGRRGEALEVALAAPPVDGAANAELVRFLAEALDLPKRDVVLVRGETAQRKLIQVASLSTAEVWARLGLGAGPDAPG